MLFICRVAFFCTLSFSASYRFNLFSLNVLFALKTLQGNFGSLTTVIFCFNLELHAFRYPRGYENAGLGGVCESEIGNPFVSVEMSLAPN